jgi:hypothetical protein
MENPITRDDINKKKQKSNKRLFYIGRNRKGHIERLDLRKTQIGLQLMNNLKEDFFTVIKS